uniref:Uncharacterized protein n=1 Tax=Anguilla anguilla TaxID=7936 RepID=A0A0E9W385_ANGAN
MSDHMNSVDGDAGFHWHSSPHPALHPSSVLGDLHPESARTSGGDTFLLAFLFFVL